MLEATLSERKRLDEKYVDCDSDKMNKGNPDYERKEKNEERNDMKTNRKRESKETTENSVRAANRQCEGDP